MNGMINYIFDNMKLTDAKIRSIWSTMRVQNKLNNTFIAMGATVAVYMILNEAEKKRQNNKIKELENDIEELKHSEGE